MIELRKSPRITVTWRAGIKLPSGKLMLVKVVNVSAEGVLVHSSENLALQSTYPMLVEIPGIANAAEIYKVSCKGTVKHTLLSGETYSIGIQLSEMSQLHSELVGAWVSKTARMS